MKTSLARTIENNADHISYDAVCKQLLSEKSILAWIMKYVTEEFKDMEISQIKRCIGSDVQISGVNVLPGLPEAEKISGESHEDSVPGEGELYYDIRFSVYYAQTKRRIKMLINVEAQKDFHPGYSLTTRGVFYGARMISAQKGTEFTGTDYDNIRKVYTIWICMNAPDDIGNAISYRTGCSSIALIMKCWY